MTEQQIVVVFDVSKASRIMAARDVESALTDNAWKEAALGLPIESWWFPEPDVQKIDGNDNPAAVLIPERLARVVLEYLRWQADHGDSLTSCARTDTCPHCEAATLAAHLGTIVEATG